MFKSGGTERTIPGAKWVFSLLARSFAPTVATVKVEQKEGGRLMVVSGATGRVVGRAMDIPQHRATHLSPILHTTFDRSKYIIFGSGSIEDVGSDGKA